MRSRECIMDFRQDTGAEAEELATKLLRRAGLKILIRNYRCKAAEVDIIAMHGEVLVFIEVRSHTSNYLADPALTITPRKQGKIALGARHYMAQTKSMSLPIRFDVVSVQFNGARHRLRWIQAAFRPSSRDPGRW
jgi:putative endonuclease